MNPGNGIETIGILAVKCFRKEFPINESRQRDWNLAFIENKLEGSNFLLMNPGNGIETWEWIQVSIVESKFPINESRQRDWNSMR